MTYVHPDRRTLKVTGLLTEELKDALCTMSTILKAKRLRPMRTFIPTRRTGKEQSSRGSAYVTFASVEAATGGLKVLHGLPWSLTNTVLHAELKSFD